MKILSGIAFAVAFAAGAAGAQQASFQPAIIFDMGGKFDKSFNEAAYNGAERFKKESGVAYREFEVTNEGQREQTLTNMVRRGASIVVSIGFAQRSAVEAVAKQNPNAKFVIIDAVVELPNVESIVFREHEGSFLVGALAAMASKSGKVGFVGGMDIPLIRRFALGYEEGAKYVNPQVEVLQNMTGTTPARLARPGPRRRARKAPVRPAAPTSSTPPRAAPASACFRRRRKQASSHRRRLRTRTTCSPARC